MDPELAATLEDLRTSLADMERRLRRLEDSAPPPPAMVVPPAPSIVEPVPLATAEEATGKTVALVGRSLIVLGGAYLLRAATDLGVLAPRMGALAALIYAGVLVVLADRAASRRAAASAAFQAGTALAIAGPLVDEMVTRLHLLGAWGAAGMMAAFCAATGWVAYRRRQPVLAWFAAIAGTGVAASVALQTRELVPCLWLLAGIAGGAGVLARRLRQSGLLALPLTVGAFAAIWLAELALAGSGEPSPENALVALLGFFAAGVGAILWSAEEPHVQGVEAGLLLPLVLIESARLAQGRWWFGAALLPLAIAGFALARVRAQVFFRGYWLTVGLIALGVMASGGLLSLLYLAVAAALLTVRASDDLEVPAALAAAAVASGLAGFALHALMLPTLTPPGWMALLVLAALIGVTAARPRTATLLLASFAASGLIAWAGITLSSPSPAVAATLRTCVLALAAIALALLSRHLHMRAARRLVYPVLVALGAKLLLDDLRVGTSATLFVDLAVCGAVLIVAPRLRTRTPGS